MTHRGITRPAKNPSQDADVDLGFDNRYISNVIISVSRLSSLTFQAIIISMQRSV